MKKRSGLRFRVVIMTIIIMSILAFSIALIGYRQYYENVLNNYVKYASLAVGLTSEVWEEYRLGDMLVRREMDPDYEAARLELNKIKNHADIKYLFAIYFEDLNDLHSVCYVINAKSDEELSTGEPYEEIYSYLGEQCEPDAFEDRVLQLYHDSIVTSDSRIHYIESMTKEYGHLVTCYRTEFDSSGNPVAIIGVDIDVNKINKDMTTYVMSIFFVFITITIAAIFLFIEYFKRFIISPVTKIAQNVDSFVSLMDQEVEPESLVYEKVPVKTKDEIKMLSDGVDGMAEGVRSYMVNLRRVTEEKQRIGAELELATKIQADMLPNIFPAFPERKEFDIHAYMTPAKEVGGDFYDFFLIDEDHLGLVIADVSGKGVPAALFMMMSKILVNNYASMGGSPTEVLERTNTQICKNNEEDMFVTVWFGILTISTGQIVAANAGHEYPILKKADGAFELFHDQHGFVIGGMDGMIYQEYEFTLEKGGTLFLYTDGVPEATNARDELFETDRMLAALNQDPNATPEQLLKNMKAAVDEFVGDAPQFDDLTMLAIHLL